MAEAVTKVPEKPRFYYGWVLVGAVIVINAGMHASAHFTIGLFFLPMVADLGVSRGALSWLPTCRTFSGAFTSIATGRLVDKYGSRFILPVAAAATALTMVAIGFAHNLFLLYLLFVILGMSGIGGQGLILTSVPLSKWFIKRRGLVLGLGSVGLAIGGTVFGPVHSLLIDWLGWRGAFMVSAVIVFATIAPVGLIFMRRQPEDMGLLPDGVSSPDPSGIKSAAFKLVENEEVSWSLRDAMRTPALWKLTLGFMMVGFASGGYTIHRFPFWEERGFDKNVVALALSTDAVVFGLAAVTAGHMMDKLSIRQIMPTANIVSAFVLILSMVWGSSFSLFFTFFIWGAATGTWSVSQMFIWANYFGRKSVGAIRGATLPFQVAAMGIGAPVAGYIYDATNTYTAAWITSIVFYCLAAIVFATTTKPRRAAHAIPALKSD